jgi:hypothetical protein
LVVQIPLIDPVALTTSVSSNSYAMRYGRVKRSGSILSVLVVELTQANTRGTKTIRRLFKSIRSITRETDIISYLCHHKLAVLLPYTHRTGAVKVSEKIRDFYNDPQITLTISTYPNHLFDSLTKNGCLSDDALRLMAEDSRVMFWIKRGLDFVESILGLFV